MTEHMHSAPYPMTFEWTPDETLTEQLATHIGLIDKSICPDTTGEFIAYWVGQPMRRHTHYQWHLKLVQRLKHVRTAFNRPVGTVVGTQVVRPNSSQAGLQVNNAAKSLVEQYGSES